MLENSLTKRHKVMAEAEKGNWPCLPSPPDERDFPLSRIAKPASLPPSVRLDSLISKVRSQGGCGVCVGKAVSAAGSAGHGKDLSSLYVYTRCKQEDGIPNEEGTYIRVANKIIHKEGSPPEEMLPYTLSAGKCLLLPQITSAMTEAAMPCRIKAYVRLWTLDEIKAALAAGKVVVAGVWVTSSFMDWKGQGNIGVPNGSIYGGHAVVFCGYDDSRQAIRGLNSWGKEWGDKGFFWLDYANVNWQCDIGIPAIFEAWAYEFSEAPKPEPTPDPGKKNRIEMWVDNHTAIVNGERVYLDTPPLIVEGRTLVPARFIAESLGAKVTWYPQEKKVVIE